MKYSNVALKDLETFSACNEAILKIEEDYQNYYGGYSSWVSGRQTYLLESAEKKIEKINARGLRLLNKEQGLK